MLADDAEQDFLKTGLLDGLDGEARRARARLLSRLQAQGFTLDELRAAAAEDRLALLGVERILRGALTAGEIEAQTGVPAAIVLRIRRLLGLPPAGPEDRVFTPADREATSATRRFIEAGLSEQSLSEITRVLGEGMARLATVTAGAFAESFLRAGDTEADVAERFETLTRELLPALGPTLSAAFAAHLRESVSRGMISRAELEQGHLAGAVPLAIAFADVVGFTRLGGELEAGELGSVAGRLAELAADAARPPVRLVKTIGDAAMLVSPEPADLVAAALELLAAARADELPELRAGIAYGEALQRSGDYFGHAVNLASRVTGAARPGSVLGTQEVRDAAHDAFEWSFAGRFRLKGVPHPLPLHRARPLRSDDSGR
jgi:adenylate cyclase